MIDKFNIEEYTNPCFPNTPYYKATVGCLTFHSDQYHKVINFLISQAKDRLLYTRKAAIEDEAMNSFYNVNK
jgi:hypothetical protein